MSKWEPMTLAEDAEWPHVFFSGCHAKAEHGTTENGILGLIIPSFAISPSVVVVDLTCLQVTVIAFD